MKVFHDDIAVTSEQIDLNGHVNNEIYLHWMIEAATKHSEAVGYGHLACMDLGGTWVARSHYIEYKRPTYLGDRLQMQTWVESIGRSMSRRLYKLINTKEGLVVCEGVTEWVFVDSVKMRPLKIPQEIVKAFETE